MRQKLPLPCFLLFLSLSSCVEGNYGLKPEGGGGSGGGASCDGTECGGTCTNVEDDPLNCGACGHDCFGGACEAGHCLPVLLADGEVGVHAIAVDETHLYWGYENVPADGGAIRRIKIDGTEKETLSTTKHARTFMMVVDATHLYWTYRQDTHRVMRMPKAGGAEQVLAEATYPTGIAVDSEFVYWANYWSCLADCFTGHVSKVPLTGGTVTILSENEPYPAYIATGGGRVIWSDEHVYDHSGRIKVWSASGVDTLATQQGRPHFVTTDGTYAYWTAPLDGTVMRALLTGASSPEPLATGEVGPGGIMRDTDKLYWIADGTIRSMPTAGGPVTSIPNAQVGGAIQDSTSFYWGEQDTGLIWRLAKPL